MIGDTILITKMPKKIGYSSFVTPVYRIRKLKKPIKTFITSVLEPHKEIRVIGVDGCYMCVHSYVKKIYCRMVLTEKCLIKYGYRMQNDSAMFRAVKTANKF